MSSNYEIFEGLWTNWERGRFFGWTLTLSTRNGTILTSFLTIFLSVAGTQFWRVLVYAFHQIWFRSHFVDGLDHQQRVLLRNSITPGYTAWLFFLQSFFWRGKVQSSVARTLPWAWVALMYVGIVACVSVFVPAKMVERAGQYRLIKPSDRCGDWNYTSLDSLALKMFRDSGAAVAYSQECYERDPSLGTSNCRTFPVANLAPKYEEKVACPFGASVSCATHNNSVPIHMYTDLIDSRKDLGVNLPDRVTFRNDVTCSILNVVDADWEDRENVTTTDGLTSRVYDYGPITWSTTSGTNYTYAVAKYASYVGLGKPYSLFVQAYWAGNDNNWEPKEGLKVADGDTAIIFFSNNGVISKTEIHDPLFYADLESTWSIDGVDLFEANEYAVPMACITKYELCNPGNNKCSGLHGLIQTFANATYDEVGLSDNQRIIANRLQTGALLMAPSAVINSRSASALRAFSTVDNYNRQLGLPNNQYLVELKGWYTTGLAVLQRYMYDYARGPEENVDGITSVPPTGDLQKEMCTRQVTRITSGTISFNMVGLLSTVATAILVIALHWCLEPLVRKIQRRGGGRPATGAALWAMDESLQLQRLLFEAIGFATWSGTGLIPVTTSGQPFGGIDHTNINKPRFVMAEQEDSKDGIQMMPPQNTASQNPFSDNNTAYYSSPNQYLNAQTEYFAHQPHFPPPGGNGYMAPTTGYQDEPGRWDSKDAQVTTTEVPQSYQGGR